MKLSKTRLSRIEQLGGGKLLGSFITTGLPFIGNVLKPLAKIVEKDVIIKIIKSLEESDLLIKGVSDTIENEAKEQRGRFLGMLLDTLGARLLKSMLKVKE